MSIDNSASQTITSDGNTPLSFDALESALGPTTEPKLEVDAEAPKAEPTQPTTVEVKTTTAEPEEKKAETEKTAEESTPKEAVTAPAPKSFKLKTVSGREVEVPLDAKVMKKIDGVEQEVSIQKALDEYSGKFVTEKRFTEIDQMKKAFEADIADTEDKLSTILTKAHKKDVLGAILEMSDIAGHDPSPIFDGIRDQLIGDLDKFMSMTQEQRDLHFANKKIEFLTRHKESSESKVQAKQANQELERQASEMRETLGVSDEYLEKARKEYESRAEYYEKTFLNGAKPNKTHFIQLADAIQRWDLASNALKLVDPELAQDDDLVNAAYNKLVGKNMATLTVEAASEIVGKPFKKKEAAVVQNNLEKKIAQVQKVSDEANEVDDNTEIEVKATKRKPKEYLDWDDEL